MHLAAVGVLYETTYRLADLAPFEAAHGRVYYILLAGERRFRAHRHMWEVGCAVCLERYGQEAPGICFRRHVEDQKMEVRLCLGINVLRALFLQLSENTHVSVPSHEEADAYAKLFRLLRHYDATYPLARFARKVGRGTDTIRRALKYVELPDVVRRLVERKEGARLPYSAAIELARLREALAEVEKGLTEDDLLIEANAFFARGQNLEQFRKYVQGRIDNARSGQMGLFTALSPQEQLYEQKRGLRRQVMKTQARCLDTAMYYAAGARTVLEGADADHFSPKSPARRLLRMSQELIEVIATYDALVAGLSLRAQEEYHDKCTQLAEQIERLAPVLNAHLTARQRSEVARALFLARSAFDVSTAANDEALALSQ